jgi:N-ethylmaleimide reductase
MNAKVALFHGRPIANVEMTQERGNRLIKTGLADSIAFGRPYIANPDLPERQTKSPLKPLQARLSPRHGHAPL